MIRMERLLKDFLEMVQIPSPSRKEGQFAAYLQKKLTELGFRVVIDQQAGQAAGSETGNLIGYLPGKNGNAQTIMFSAHLDTVTPCQSINPQDKGEIICTDGTSILGADDKAGIAAILEAVRHLQEENIPHGPLEVVFTVCEEVGLLGSRYLDYSLVQADCGYVLDGGGEPGTIINRGPAQDKLKAVIRGRAAHAGINPEDGISAIQVAAKAIAEMNLLRIDAETTANIGYISGGGATNIVTEVVELHGEARSLDEQKLAKQSAHMRACLEQACKKYQAKLELEFVREYDAFRMAEDEAVVQLAIKAVESLGLPLQIAASGGGCDANFFNTKGIKTINLGTGMSQVHTTTEYINKEDLINLTRLVAAIIQQAAY